MKQFLLRVFYLLLAVWVCQYLLFIAFKHTLDNHSQFRYSRFFRQPEHKYFVLGNSRAMNTVNEKLARESLGLDLINLGFNGMTANYIFPVIDEINKHNKGSEIFIEITAFDAPKDDDQDYSFFISNSESFKKIIPSKKYDVLPLLRLNSIFFLRSMYFYNKPDDHSISSRIISSETGKKVASGGVMPMITDKKAFEQMIDSIQQLCSSHGNTAHFFLAPYYPPSLKRFNDYNEITALFEQKKYLFTDLNKSELDNNMFADRVHTNIAGANAMTTVMFQRPSTN